MAAPRDPVEFRDSLGIRPFSPAWRATLKAFYGTPLEPEERKLFLELSGGVDERPGVGWVEGLFNVGRGGGKDDSIKTVVHFECRHGLHEVAAAPGQRLPVLVICPLTNQARGMLRMIQGEAAIGSKRHILRETNDSIEFVNGLAATVTTCDSVAVVGETVPMAVRNEWALFPGPDSATPDTLIDSNLRPALRQIAGAPPHRLIGITSSYTKDSLAWRTFTENFGKSEDVLVVKGSTETFNPNIDRDWLARERRRLGERAYAMHFECEWVEAIQDGWFGDCVDSCIDRGRTDEAAKPLDGVDYVAAIDQAFRGDRFALAIAHREHRADGPPLTILDRVTWWESDRGEALDVRETVEEVSEIILEWGCSFTFADQFSFDPLKELFRREGVHLRDAPWTSASKPQRFQRVRSEMASGTIRLPDERDLIREFHSIRGKLLRSGGEQLEGRGGHDDLVHAAVMALYFAADRSPDWGDRDRADHTTAAFASSGHSWDGGMPLARGWNDHRYVAHSSNKTGKLVSEMTPEERRAAFFNHELPGRRGGTGGTGHGW